MGLSVKTTKTSPSVDWCVNKDTWMAELYKYRADCPEVIEVIKDLKKAKLDDKNFSLRKSQDQHWYSKAQDFMKFKKIKEDSKKREKVKKASAPSESMPAAQAAAAAVVDHSETLNT